MLSSLLLMQHRPFLLLNEESNGVGKPNRIANGLTAIASSINHPFPLRPRLRRAVSYQPVDGILALDTIAANAALLQSTLATHLAPSLLYNLGGDCGSELTAIAHSNFLARGELQVIWFDAHADLNSPSTTPSGAFHGMVLRTLMGDGPARLGPFVPLPLKPSQIHFAGLRLTDPGEQACIDEHSLALHSVAAIEAHPDALAQTLSPHRPVYIHFDYDVLDGTAHPESSYPTPHGLSPETAIRAITAIRERAPIAAMSLTEFAPATPQPSPALLELLARAFHLR